MQAPLPDGAVLPDTGAMDLAAGDDATGAGEGEDAQETDAGEPAGEDASTDDPAPDSSGAPDSSLAQGLLVRYPLDLTPATEVLDDSGSRAGAMHGGASWTDLGFPDARFPNGGALVLDGASGLVTLPTAGLPGVAETKSVSLWFWQAAPSSSLRKTLLALTNPDAGAGLQLGLQGGVPSVWFWRQLIGTAIVAAPSQSRAGWTHLALIQDGTTCRLYVDGTLVDSSRALLPSRPVTSFMLGGYAITGGEDELWRGRLDDVRLYGRALSSAEVSALANGAR